MHYISNYSLCLRLMDGQDDLPLLLVVDHKSRLGVAEVVFRSQEKDAGLYHSI